MNSRILSQQAALQRFPDLPPGTSQGIGRKSEKNVRGKALTSISKRGVILTSNITWANVDRTHLQNSAKHQPRLSSMAITNHLSSLGRAPTVWIKIPKFSKHCLWSQVQGQWENAPVDDPSALCLYKNSIHQWCELTFNLRKQESRVPLSWRNIE